MSERQFESREEWLNWRLGKITGSSVKDFIGNGRGDVKPGIYRAAAESLIGAAAIAESDLTSSQVLQRGHDLEPECIKRFEKETGKKVRKGLFGWESEADSRIIVSPDAPIGKTEAFEGKCLLSTKHVEALYTRNIPAGNNYREQIIQYFVSRKPLTTVYLGFYHPDFPAPLDFFYLTFTRKELAEEIAAQEEAEKTAAAKIREIVNALSLYSPDEIAKREEVAAELLADAKAEHTEGLSKVRKPRATKSK